MRAEGRHLRFINRRIVKPYLSAVLDSEDILEATGGIERLEEEEVVGVAEKRPGNDAPEESLVASDSKDDKTVMSISDHGRATPAYQYALSRVPRNGDVALKLETDDLGTLGQGDKKGKETPSTDVPASQTTADPTTTDSNANHDDAEDQKVSIGDLTGGLIRIPKSILLALLGYCGIDGKKGTVPLWAIDPYPGTQHQGSGSAVSKKKSMKNTEKDQKGKRRKARRGSVLPGQEEEDLNPDSDNSNAYPMQKLMFNWLVEHMQVFRPDLLPPGSGDRGQLLSTRIGIKLDRLHCESSMTLKCGSVVVIQLLQGVLEGASLMGDDISGTPSGAIRYCPAHLIPKLYFGLTVVLFDYRGGVVRCIELKDR